MSDDGARGRLLEALADEEPEVVRWSAFGLGRVCKGEDAVVRALVLRATGLAAFSPKRPAAALAAVARALGRCGNSEAERSLRAWLALEPAIAEEAALALGTLAMRRGSLDDASWAALLDASARRESPVQAALFAFGRVSAPDGPVRQRMVELAVRALPGPELPRRFALRALGRGGSPAVAPLRAFAERDDVSALERAEAFRELARVGGDDAHDALGELLPARLAALGPALLDPARAAELGAFMVLLEAQIDARARPALERLARLDLPEREPARRRAVRVRCAAAQVLANRSSLHDELLACDPDPNGRSGKLAVLRVLDRGELTGARAKRYRSLVEDGDPVVRQKALELLGSHPELPETVDIVSLALRGSTPGTLATIAEFLSAHPGRAGSVGEGGEPRPDPEILELLATTFRLQQKQPSLEVRSALIDAAGALGALALKPDIERDCTSDDLDLRNHAERALRALGERGRRCERGTNSALPPEELERAVLGRQRIEFETEVGNLWMELDATAAPVAVTRIVELANKGFFDGMPVHRVVPGFVVQFGDPSGDGYGGVERRPLRSELGPEPFEAGAVGVALSGPDTGSSQIFVTLGSYPHLDGEYSRIGRAGPGWERVLEGDRLLRARLRP